MGRPTRYSQTVLDHFENPRNVGVIEAADADATVSHAECGDTVRLTLRIKEGVIQAARFKALGCGAAIAAASRLTELLVGLALERAAALDNEAVAASLGGLPDHKIRCSVLAREAVAAALEDYWRKAALRPRAR